MSAALPASRTCVPIELSAMASVPFDPSTYFDPNLVPGVEPAWEIAHLFPPQGQWSEAEYLLLTESTNWLVELVDGRIEVLAMPTIGHQLVLRFLMDALRAFVEPRNLGVVLFAPTRVWVRDDNFREPDILFQFSEHHAQRNVDGEYYRGADLVMEVVSPDAKSVKRDHEEKRGDYAAAGIAEYWIVDPQQQVIEVLALDGKSYALHGVFREGAQATSKLLDRLAIDVSATFAAAKA